MINYLIVDDETIAHEILEDYCSQLSQFKLVKNCYNAFEAIEYLSSNKVDLLFLDINMPKLNGFEMLQTLAHTPKVIVTTAYHEFAVESYDLEVIDYLLKPFSMQRFLKAINRFHNQNNVEPKNNDTLNDQDQYIFLKEGKKYIQIKIQDILYIQAYGNYNKVYTNNKTITTLEKLNAYERLLPEGQFIQVHKSYIVSISKIEMIQNNAIYIGQHKIPIGQTYKNRIIALLKDR